MSPRRAKRRDETPAPMRPGVQPTTELHADGEWVVRPIAATRDGKTYRCPGCEQVIVSLVSHLVAWRPGEEDNRRHWHTPCWRARFRRGADVQRTRNAPRHG